MLHVWFTHDLRSAFAVHAPVPELCRDGLLGAAACAAGREPPRDVTQAAARAVQGSPYARSVSDERLVRFRPRAILTVVGVLLGVAIILRCCG